MSRFHPTPTKISLAVTILALTFSPLMVATSDAQIFGFGERNSSGKSSKVMAKARAAMAEKLSITAKDGRFLLEFPTHEQAEEIGQSIIENSYTNSQSSNGDDYFCQTESEVAQFMINSGTDQWGQETEGNKVIRLTALNDATNRVEIELELDTQNLSMVSLNLAQERIHIVRQTTDKLTLVSVQGDSFDFMSGSTINELFAKSEFAATLGRFRKAGLGVPKVASHSRIEMLVESILNFSDDDRKNFEAKFPNLVSKKFKLRKQAAQELSKRLDEHLVAVSAMLTSNNLPLEMRARFVEAIESSEDESAVLMINTITDGNLTESPAILVKLLKHQIESKTAAQTIQKTMVQLEKTTGQKFGDDAVAWSDWLQESSSRKDAAKPDAEPNSQKTLTTEPPAVKAERPARIKRRRLRKTGREQVQEPLKDLLTLRLSGRGNLLVDRAHWSKIFNDKTPGQLMREVKQSFEGSGLPKSWLKMGGEFNIAGLGYEQILFERIADNVKIRSENPDYAADINANNTRSLNRRMYKSDLRMTLLVHPQGNRWEDVRKKRAYFKFLFEDEVEDMFYLLSEHPKTGFSIFVFWKNGETVLNLRCDQNGKVQLDYVFEKQQTSVSAASVQNFVDQNRDLLSKKLLPLLNKCGISADNALRPAVPASQP